MTKLVTFTAVISYCEAKHHSSNVTSQYIIRYEITGQMYTSGR